MVVRESCNFNWITSLLAVGGKLEPAHALQLARVHQISRVVDVRAESCDDPLWFCSQNIEFLSLPTQDMEPLCVSHLRQGVLWCQEALRNSERVLIHCEHGIGRSAMLACCVLVSEGYSAVQALTLTKRARPCVSPSPDQLGALVEWCSQVGAVRANWEELAMIAYRGAP